jgi:phage head maturation protease
MLTVQGYATVWNYEIPFDGGREIIRPNAIVMDTPLNIALQFGAHEDGAFVLAETKRASLRFHSDDIGLAFEADIDDRRERVRGAARSIGSGDVFECSVHFAHIDAELVNGCTIINRARIDHVAIVHSGAYGERAVCWLAEQPEEHRTPRVRAIASQWRAGRPQAPAPPAPVRVLARSAASSTCARPVSPAFSWNGKVPPSVDRVLRMAGMA